MKGRVLAGLAGVFLIAATAMSLAAGNESEAAKKKAAQTAAESWLKLMDKGEYAESWGQAASIFKSAIAEEQWAQQARAAREPLGKMTSRTFKSADYETSLPGAPDGEYVVIQFSASFANKKDAVETVTPMLDKDGKWRVSGYYIK